LSEIFLDKDSESRRYDKFRAVNELREAGVLANREIDESLKKGRQKLIVWRVEELRI